MTPPSMMARCTTSTASSRSGWRDGRPRSPSRSTRRRPRSLASTSSTCSRTPRATCTWGMPRPSPTGISWRAIGGSRASTCCTRSGGTRSAFPPRTRPLSGAPIPASGRTRTSRSRRAASSSTETASTGAGSCTPATPSTTRGTSGCSSSCMKRVSPTARTVGSTGTRWIRPFWPTSRCCPMERANAAAPWWSRRS